MSSVFKVCSHPTLKNLGTNYFFLFSCCRVFSSWHLLVIYFLVEPNDGTDVPHSAHCTHAAHTLHFFLSAGSRLPVSPRATMRFHSYGPSKVTFDLFTGMLCRHRTNTTLQTPPAGALTLSPCLTVGAVSQRSTHPAALAATMTHVIRA